LQQAVEGAVGRPAEGDRDQPTAGVPHPERSGDGAVAGGVVDQRRPVLLLRAEAGRRRRPQPIGEVGAVPEQGAVGAGAERRHPGGGEQGSQVGPAQEIGPRAAQRGHLLGRGVVDAGPADAALGVGEGALGELERSAGPVEDDVVHPQRDRGPGHVVGQGGQQDDDPGVGGGAAGAFDQLARARPGDGAEHRGVEGPLPERVGAGEGTLGSLDLDRSSRAQGERHQLRAGRDAVEDQDAEGGRHGGWGPVYGRRRASWRDLPDSVRRRG
jgi:hypothetical protein